jgi:hypothetical protein
MLAIPFFPDCISFLIYGLVTGLLLKLWRITKKHLFLMPFFLVPYQAMQDMMEAEYKAVQESYRQLKK